MVVAMENARVSNPSTKSGFTLVELLVVIVIVVSLASLIFILMQRANLSAAKTRGIGQMRNIGVAAASWAADNGRLEPFYYANGSGDYPQEWTGKATKVTPGNPPRALYNMEDPDSGYVQNPADFFSPLAKETAPSRKDYDPQKSSVTRPWGTYTWYFPFVSEPNRAGRYSEIRGELPAKVNERVSERLLMCECYAISKPKFGKPIYHALLSDGSIQSVAESDDAFNKWKRGD